MNAPFKPTATPGSVADEAIRILGEQQLPALITALADEMIRRVEARLDGARNSDGVVFRSRDTGIYADDLIDAPDIRETVHEVAKQMDALLFEHGLREMFASPAAKARAHYEAMLANLKEPEISSITGRAA